MRQHDQALLLLEKAGQDESLLDEVIASERVSDEIFGFHCQQAAEKLLKAVLSELGIRFRRTHDLRELMDLLADNANALPPELQDLDALTPYGTLFRYHGIPASVSLDREGARDLVRRLRAWVEQKMSAA